jgi:hypothetical protein
LLQHTKPTRQQSQNISSEQRRTRSTIQPRQQEQKADKHAIPQNSVRGPGQAGPEACPTRPSQHPNRCPIQEIISPHQPNTQFAQGTSHKRGPRNAPRACSPACAEASWPAEYITTHKTNQAAEYASIRHFQNYLYGIRMRIYTVHTTAQP